MGGQQSVSEQEEELPTIKHQKFQQVQFLKGGQIMKTLLSLDNYSDFQKWEQQLNKVAKFDDEVLLLPKAYQCMRKAVCGSSASLNIEYDNYPYILKEELQNRENIKSHFSQEEVWYLLYSLCQATHDFRFINSKVGDIRPGNIFINEDGQIKVSNLYSWPCETTNYDKFIFDKQLTYLSPEEVEGTREGKVEMFIDKYQAQSFSLGLTVLETGVLQSCGKLYNPKTNSFSRYQLTRILKEWWNLEFEEKDEETQKVQKTSYSLPLKLAVAALCQVSPEERLTSEEVYKWLYPHRQSINQLKEFDCGLPIVKNMKKYQPFIVDYHKKNQTQIKNNQQPQKLNAGYPPQSNLQPPLQNPPLYQHSQFQNPPQNILNRPPLYQNYDLPQIQKPVQQQPFIIQPEKNNGVQVQKNPHLKFFKNVADSHQHAPIYTPTHIKPSQQINQFHHISHLHHELHPDSSSNNLQQKPFVPSTNPISYQGYPSTTITEKKGPTSTFSQYIPQNQESTYAEIKKQKGSDTFLKRIDEALAQSRKNNPS